MTPEQRKALDLAAAALEARADQHRHRALEAPPDVATIYRDSASLCEAAALTLRGMTSIGPELQAAA